eukprot:5467762-Amphidinium_carterae.1
MWTDYCPEHHLFDNIDLSAVYCRVAVIELCEDVLGSGVFVGAGNVVTTGRSSILKGPKTTQPTGMQTESGFSMQSHSEDVPQREKRCKNLLAIGLRVKQKGGSLAKGLLF